MRHLCPHCRRLGTPTQVAQHRYLLTLVCRYCGGAFNRVARTVPLAQRCDPGALKERQMRQWAAVLNI